MAGSKSLSPEQNRLAREHVRAMIQRKWGGDQSLAATAFRVSQPTVSEFLSGGKGLGPKLLSGIMQVDARVAAAILGGAAAVIDVEGEEVTEAQLPALPAPAPAALPPPYQERMQQREARLSNVREKLLKRYDRAAVNEVIASSEFMDGLNVSELDAFDRLDEILQLHKAETEGTLVTGKIPEHTKEPPPVGSFPSSVSPAGRKVLRAKAAELSKGNRKRSS